MKASEQPIDDKATLPAVTESNVVAVTADQSNEIAKLKAQTTFYQLQLEQRWKIIKLIVSVFGSLTMFSFLIILTGLSTELSKEGGSKVSYQFNADKLTLAVPIAVSVFTAIIGSQLKAILPEKESEEKDNQ